MVELIAECATNSGGSVPLAKEFIHRFAEAGADWVKFQYTRVQHLRPDDPQYDWFKQAEFSDEQFAELKAYTESLGKKFLLTVYNHQDVPAVAKLSTEAIKTGSGEQHEKDLLYAILGLSEGRLFMSGDSYRRFADETNMKRTTFFRCIPWYPTLARAAFDAARHPFGGSTLGWSDHGIGIEACQLAIINGARIIEKHVQLPNQARPMKAYEATVEEFKGLHSFADQHPDRFLGRWQYA